LGGFFHHGLLYWLLGPFRCHRNSQIDGLGFIGALIPCDALPHSLKDLNANLKVKTMEEERVGVCSLVCNTSRVKECVGFSGWGLGQMTSGSIIHIDLHKPKVNR